MKNSYALVTGATSGIGLEISKDLAKRGYDLILVARTKDKLVSLSSELASEYNIDCDFFSSDLTLINSPNEIYEYTSQKKYNVNILINNAGYALPNAFHENSLEDEEKCLRVLGTSVIALTKKYINDSLKPFMGVTLSKGTVCNLNFPKNSLIMQLESDDVDFDIEKKIDETI